MQSKTSPSHERAIPKTRRGKTAASPAPDTDLRKTSELGAAARDAGSVAEAPTLEPPNEPVKGGTPAPTDLGPEPSTRVTAPTTTPSKLDRLIDLLRRPEGSTLREMCAATGWQVHSVRGAMAGSLKRKGHVILSEKQDGIRRYRIGAAS